MLNQVPTPQPSESFEDYCIRGHKSLMQSVPNASDRNQMVWNSWEMSNPSTVRYKAQSIFNNYRLLPNVCHFAEHSTNTKTGLMQVGVAELRDICKNMNRRINEANLYPPLINRHTQDGPMAHLAEPQIIGYSANYRLGMIGDKDQRFAIFGDEFHNPQHLQEVRSKPRRSVELIRNRDMSKSYFDPIACLGAESPRIEIPPAYYSAGNDDAEVVRYSVSAPVYAGASNTFIPNFDDAEKSRNQAVPQESPKMLSPEDVTQLVDAVKSALGPDLEFLQTLRSQQSGGMQQQPQPGMEQPQMADPNATPAAPAAPAAPSPTPAQGDELKYGGGMGGMMPAPMQFSQHKYSESESDSEDSTVERYAALEEYCEDLKEKYSALAATHGQTNQRLATLERERSDAIRSHKIYSLAQQYPGMVDFDEEADKVLYSAGSEMDDEEFEAYCDTIERFAARTAPPEHMVPDGDTGENETPSKERYSARVQNEVVRRITSAVQRGEALDYSEVENQVMADFSK